MIIKGTREWKTILADKTERDACGLYEQALEDAKQSYNAVLAAARRKLRHQYRKAVNP